MSNSAYESSGMTSEWSRRPTERDETGSDRNRRGGNIGGVLARLVAGYCTLGLGSSGRDADWTAPWSGNATGDGGDVSLPADPPRVVAVTAHRHRELRAPLERVDVHSHVIELDPSAGFVVRNFQAVRQLRRAIRDHDPDVVLYDCRELTGVLVTLVCLLADVPTVFRFKGDYWRGLEDLYRPERGDGTRQWLRYQASRVANELTYAVAEGFVTVSEDLKRTVARRTGRDLEKVQTVPVPLDPERPSGTAARARSRFDVEADTVFLTVTNLSYQEKYKGVETAVKGMCSVLEAHDDVAYVVAAGGRYHEELIALLDEHVTDPDVRDRMYAPGFVDAVEDLYALADGFVYISHLDGYPNAVLEAQQSGLPVVANADFGMVEQVEDGQTGRLLADPTADDVASAVESLLADPSEGRRLGANARRSVQRENAPTVNGCQLVTALARITRSESD